MLHGECGYGKGLLAGLLVSEPAACESFICAAQAGEQT